MLLRRGKVLVLVYLVSLILLCTSYNMRQFGRIDTTYNRAEKKLQVSTTHSPTQELVTIAPVSTLLRGELELPSLSKYDKELLSQGQRICRQNRNGRSGSGFVVLDIKVPAEKVYEALTKFQIYNQMIPTVKEVRIYSSNDTTTEAEYSLSKFRLKVNIINTVFPEQRLVRFESDPTKSNIVLKHAEGFWFVQSPSDRPGYSRVWLTADIQVSKFIPNIIADYAAERAFPRATSWLTQFDFNSL